MRIARGCTVFIVSLFLPATWGQAQDPPRRDPRAVSILTASTHAMGGGALPTVRDTVATVQVTTISSGQTNTHTETLKTMGTRRFRIDADSDQGRITWVFAEGRGQSKRGGEAPQRLSKLAVARGGITHLPLLSILADWIDPRTKLEYVGLESTEAGTFHHIRIKEFFPQETGVREELPPCEVFLDAQTLVVAKLVYPVHAESNLRISVPVTVTYSDCRVVAGLLIPFRITYSMRGRVFREYTVTSVAVNQGLTAADFEVR